jgi:hypothetical protein
LFHCVYCRLGSVYLRYLLCQVCLNSVVFTVSLCRFVLILWHNRTIYAQNLNVLIFISASSAKFSYIAKHLILGEQYVWPQIMNCLLP